jgi:hypothetical protein
VDATFTVRNPQLYSLATEQRDYQFFRYLRILIIFINIFNSGIKVSKEVL